MPFLNSIINWINFKRIYQIDLFKEHPHDVQREILFGLIDKAKNTEWGEKYDFAEISSEKQFRERLPIQRYDDVRPTIEQLMKGKKNLIWPGDTRWFAKSSGTTSDKSKFIPVSKDSLEDIHIRGGRDVLAFYLKNNPESKLLTGKTLTLGGSHQINNFNNRSYYGDLSAIIIDNIPFWTEFLRTPSTEISLIDEFEKKVAKIIEHSLDEKVTGFAGVPSWYLVEVASLAALVLGIWGAIRFSYITSDFIVENINYTSKHLGIISFIATFIIIVILVYMVGKAVDNLIKVAQLGFINRLAGLVFGFIKSALILSIVIMVFDSFDETIHIIPKKTKERSLVYEPIRKLVPTIFPFVKFWSTETFFDKKEDEEPKEQIQQTVT